MKKIFLSLFIVFSFLSSFAQTELPKGTASGTNTYAATISGGPATLKDGAQIILKLTNAPTGASTLNLNSLGAKAVKLNNVAIASGDLAANVYMLFTYNASAGSWQVSKPGAPAISTGQWNLTGNVLGADTKWLGSSDNFNVGFKTNNTVRETILKSGEHIWGPGTTLSGAEFYSFQGGDVYVDDNFLVNNAITTSSRTLFGGGWIATAGMTFGVASTTNGTLVFKNSTNANTLTLNSGVTSASHAWTLPTTQGASSTFLQNNGSGVLSWATVTPAWLLDGNTNGAEKWFGTTDAFDLPFRTNNTEKMRLTTGGFLGIGTTPIFKVDILGTDATTGLFVQSQGFQIANTTTSGFSAIGLGETYDGTTPSYLRRYGSTYGTVALRGVLDITAVNEQIRINEALSVDYSSGEIQSLTNCFWTSSNGNYKINPNTGDSWLLASNFGLGLNAPTARLHVKGSGSGSGTYAMKVQNIASTPLFEVRDDGYVSIPYGATPTFVAPLTVGTGGGSGGAIAIYSTFSNSVFDPGTFTTADIIGGGGKWGLRTNVAGDLNFDMGVGFAYPTYTHNALKIEQKGLVTFSRITNYDNGGAYDFTGASENPALKFVKASSLTWATGTVATQREYIFEAPTYARGGSGAVTITNASSMAIEGAPIGNNTITITNTHALNIGTVDVTADAFDVVTNSYGLTVNAQTGATNNFTAQFLGSGNVTITGDGRLYGSALHNNSGAVTGTTNQYIASGTYTFTPVNVTNVSASTGYEGQWIRVGNVVTVSGKVDIDATLAIGTATELGIPLPIPSDFTADENAGGDALSEVAIAGITASSARVRADATNNRAAVIYNSLSTSNDPYSFQFTYVIK